MREFSEDDVEKVSTPPIVHDATLPSASEDQDAGPNTGVLIAVVGTPFGGAIPVYDAALGYCVWSSGGSVGGASQMLIYDETTGVLGDLRDADGNPMYGYPE